ncbi:MAG: hypothetical protein K8R56_04530, partial [Candidatus Eisenbacteria bacterium]|nr:hypothetical protein [Candidatus Eisenbacteria bacterium]
MRESVDQLRDGHCSNERREQQQRAECEPLVGDRIEALQMVRGQTRRSEPSGRGVLGQPEFVHTEIVHGRVAGGREQATLLDHRQMGEQFRQIPGGISGQRTRTIEHSSIAKL